LDVKHPSIADSSDVWGWELAKTLFILEVYEDRADQSEEKQSEADSQSYK
jgi:hypothetical protein